MRGRSSTSSKEYAMATYGEHGNPSPDNEQNCSGVYLEHHELGGVTPTQYHEVKVVYRPSG